MPEEPYQGAPSGDLTVSPGTIALSDLEPHDFMALGPTQAQSHPQWMVTHFPVSMEEFHELKQAAEESQPQALETTATDTPTDLDQDVEIGDESVPEDEMGPEAAPVVGHSFAGLPQTSFEPPDCAIGVGPDDVLVAVNTDLAGYRKDGSLRFRWPNMATLFRAVLPADAGIFDPQVHYDHYAGRFIVVVAARRENPAGSWMLLGVTQTADPAGAWWVWALDFAVDGSTPTNNWADYPMLGIDAQAIYIGTNQFRVGGGFSYGKLRILNKREVYAGAAVGWWDFWNLRNPDDSLAFTVHPARHFRGASGNPPGYLLNAVWPRGNRLTMWHLRDPLGSWAGRAPVLERWSVDCASYDLPPDAEQKDGTNRIETNDSRVLNLVYQHAGGVERLWATHTTRTTWQGDTDARAAVRWYEIDVPTRRVAQQNTYGASGSYYFFPVVQTDINRNAYFTFTRSNNNEYGQLRQTGRRVNAPANDLENSRLIRAGESAYRGGRWGDYFGCSRDGGDARRAWLYGEYAATRSTWGTWVHSASF